MIKIIKDFLFAPSAVVYGACRMTGRDQTEMVQRALFLKQVFEAKGIKFISPVLEEGLAPNNKIHQIPNREYLELNWRRDKEILRYQAHVVVMDGADEGSVGMNREYGINRYYLWKPTLILWGRDRGITVADFEDDAIVFTPQAAAAKIAANWLTRWQRWTWRAKLLTRCLPQFVKDQLYAWR